MATGTAIVAIARFCLRRNASAPSWIAFEISCIAEVPDPAEEPISQETPRSKDQQWKCQ